jgi:hypothetical protein
LRYNLWFGTVDDGIRISEDFKKSFLLASNESPLPFSVSELGLRVLGRITTEFSEKRQLRLLRKGSEKSLEAMRCTS